MNNRQNAGRFKATTTAAATLGSGLASSRTPHVTAHEKSPRCSTRSDSSSMCGPAAMSIAVENTHRISIRAYWYMEPICRSSAMMTNTNLRQTMMT